MKGSAVSYHPTKPIEQRQGLKNTRIISTEYLKKKNATAYWKPVYLNREETMMPSAKKREREKKKRKENAYCPLLFRVR